MISFPDEFILCDGKTVETEDGAGFLTCCGRKVYVTFSCLYFKAQYRVKSRKYLQLSLHSIRVTLFLVPPIQIGFLPWLILKNISPSPFAFSPPYIMGICDSTS